MNSGSESVFRQVDRKALGAYYTDSQIADFLVWWAVRSPADAVMDPSFGGGVFLRAAAKRLRSLGGDPRLQLRGVELDHATFTQVSDRIRTEFQTVPNNLVRADFFDVLPARPLDKVDAIVGNPPFIRYQRFTGDVRKTALLRAAEQGLKLSKLCSSWLPFLVHCLRFLKPHGKLGMVIPFEIAHASYANPVLRHLAVSFSDVTLLTFRKKLFPELSEDTLLLLAGGYSDVKVPNGKLKLRDLAHAGELLDLQADDILPIRKTRSLNVDGIASGEERLIEYLVPPKTRDLYRELIASSAARRLGEFVDVGIGYVTGANDFFHLDRQSAATWEIPARYLRKCIRRGRGLQSLELSHSDWDRLSEDGDGAYLLELPADEKLPAAVSNYIAHGCARGVHETFKCRNRKPWYRVPHVHRADGFLTYMSGVSPRLFANGVEAVAPNTLHVLRLHPQSQLSMQCVAALWQTSLTRLSAEIEGHALGGGMLKLEPGEAERVVLPHCSMPIADDLMGELDTLARTSGFAAVQARADDLLLRQRLGLSEGDVKVIRDGAESLRLRRSSRGLRGA